MYWNNDAVAKAFSSAAARYDEFAGVQQQIALRTATLLPALTWGRILEFGCGTGFLTEEIASRYAGRHPIVALDIAPQMIAQAHRRCGTKGISYHCEDLCRYNSDQQFSLVVSSTTLQWIVPLDLALERIKSLMEPGGEFVFSIIVSGTLHEVRYLREELFPQKPAHPPLLHEEEVLSELTKCGFLIEHAEVGELQANYTSADEFFLSLRALGVNSAGGQSNSTLTPRELRQLHEGLIRRYPEEIPATYRALYVHCRKGLRG